MDEEQLDAPRGWDLDWQPDERTGAPSRFPPAADAVYSEFPIRALAFALDVVLLWLVFQLLTQGRALIVFFFTRDAPDGNDPALVWSGLVATIAIALVTLVAIYFWRVFRATPGQLLLGLFVVQRATGLPLSRRGATLRWLVLYAPLAFALSYTVLIDVVFRSDLIRDMAPGGDPLIVAAAAYFLPVLWYIVLGLSVLAERRRGRGLHDRLAGSVVVRRAGPPG